MSRARSGPAASILNATRRLLASFMHAGESRIKLAIVELQEERNRFFSLLISTFLALMLAAFGIGMLMLWIVVYFWDTHRLLAIGCAAGVLLVIAAILALRVKVVASRPTLLRSTLARLSEDREQVEEHLDQHGMGRELERDVR